MESVQVVCEQLQRLAGRIGGDIIRALYVVSPSHLRP